jgi:hypothetical protein
MIAVTASTTIFLAVTPTDFRKQIDGHVAYCRHVLVQNPLTSTGVLFVFINRSHTMIRVLAYDGNGCWLMTKRLSTGTFSGWPTARDKSMASTSATQLLRLLQINTPGLVRENLPGIDG